MAATGSGGGGAPPFSIRGYTARARAGAADEGGRCWPLGGEAGPLPPIEVRRFRWWADEAALAKELVEEDGEEEERRKAAMRRKRSLVELLVAVPRVTAEGDEGRRVRRKLDKGKAVAGGSAKKGALKKDKAPSTEIAASKKEKSGNVKGVSLSISQLFQDAIRKRKLKKSSSKKRKNEEVSVLLNKKNIKGSKKSVLSNQKVIKNSSEVQTILKKLLRTEDCTFLKDSNATCPSKSSLKSKHVTFSDADDICELNASHPKDNTEQSQVVQASQQHSERDSSQVVDDQRNTEDAISETVEEDSSSLSEKVGSSGASNTVPLTSSKEKTILRNSMDLNRCIEISKRGNGNCMSSAALSSQGLAQKYVGVNFPLQEDLYLGIGRQAERMMPQGSSAPAGLALDARPRNFMRIPLPQPSSSCYVASLKEASDRSRSTIIQERLNANCHLTEVHTSFLRSGNDMVSSINTSTGSNKSTDAQTTDSSSACRNMSFSGGYMSIPLNSHGEFMRVQPGGTLNPDVLLKRQSLGKDLLHPSTSPTFVTPNTCLDYSHLRINHQGQAPPFFTVANFGIPPDPYLTPKVPTAYSMGFRQCPTSERMEAHNYAIPSSNHEESSEQCSCAQCLGHDNQLQKTLKMQGCFPRQNYEQNIQPAVDTTMRLMGKTVSLGTGSKQYGGLDNWGPCSSKQIRAEDHYFPGMHTQAFPQSFQGGLVDLPSRFGISNGGRPPSEYISFSSSVTAAEQGSGFSKSNQSEQPQLAVPNKVSVQPVSRYNEVGLGHQRPAVANQVQRGHQRPPVANQVQRGHQRPPVANQVQRGHQRPAVANQVQRGHQRPSVANQVQRGHQQPAVANQVQRVQSTASHLQLGAVDGRRPPSVAAMAYYDPWNKFKNFVETTPRPSQSRFFPQNSSNMTQRPPISPTMSGYSVQSTPPITTPTKFTSLRPLPPSMVSSHVYSTEGAQPNGSTPFHPAAPLSSQPGKFNAPGGAILKDNGSMKQPHGSTPFHPAAPLSSQPGKVNAPGGAILKDNGSMKQPHGSTQFHPPAPLSSQPGKVNAPGGAILKDNGSMKQPHGSTLFHPPAPLSSQPGKVSAPGGAILKDKGSMKQAPIGSDLQSSKQMEKSFNRPAGKDAVLALPNKPCIAAGNDLNPSPLPGKGLELCGSRPYGQPRYIPVVLNRKPEMNPGVVNNDTPTRAACAESINSVGTGPVKLRSGAKHILQPCAGASMDQEDSWPVHSVVQSEVEDEDCIIVESSKKTDLC
ncbi:unnamed protein product [Alopecurus aequalis]